MNKLRKVLDIIEHKHLDAIIVLSDYNRRYFQILLVQVVH